MAVVLTECTVGFATEQKKIFAMTRAPPTLFSPVFVASTLEILLT